MKLKEALEISEVHRALEGQKGGTARSILRNHHNYLIKRRPLGRGMFNNYSLLFQEQNNSTIGYHSISYNTMYTMYRKQIEESEWEPE